MSTPTPPPSSATFAFGHSRLARWSARALRVADQLAPDLATRLAVNLFFTPLPTKLATRRRVPSPWQLQPVQTESEQFALLRHAPAGVPSHRPRVLLVHGWAGDALQMRPLGEAVAAAGFEPVLMDLPAHGRSAGWRCTMPQIVRSVFEAHHVAGPFAGIVAHSMGAVACLHAMAVGLPVPRLVALAPSSTPEAVLHGFGKGFGLRPAHLERMRTRVEIHEQMLLAEFEPRWLGPRVRSPVLLVHDIDDRMAPFGNSKLLLKELVRAQLHATEGLSHRRVLKNPYVIDVAVAHLVAGTADGGSL